MAIQILIVDDSKVTRRFLSRVVELSGMEVGEFLQASDGEEALAVLKSNPVDLVLADINMPKMNGEQFLRELKSNPETCRIPVIVISSDGTDNRRSRVLSLGAQGYVSKPVTPEVLRTELERVLCDSWSNSNTGSVITADPFAHGGCEAPLTRLTARALETMCFVSLDGVAPDDMPGAEDSVSVRVRYTGDASGWLSLSISYQAAIAMTANYFGAGDLEQVQPDQVESFAGELANVICGTALGWHKPTGNFHLTPPEIVHEVNGTGSENAQLRMTYLVEGGWICVGLSTGPDVSLTPGEGLMQEALTQSGSGC